MGIPGKEALTDVVDSSHMMIHIRLYKRLKSSKVFMWVLKKTSTVVPLYPWRICYKTRVDA